MPSSLASIFVYEDPSDQLFIIDEGRNTVTFIPKEEPDMLDEEQLMRENGMWEDWFGKGKDKSGKPIERDMPVMTLSALRASSDGNDKDAAGFSQTTGWWDDWFGNGGKKDPKKPNNPPARSPIGKNTAAHHSQYASNPASFHPTHYSQGSSNSSKKSALETLTDFVLNDGFGFAVGFLSAATLLAFLLAVKYALYGAPPEYEKLMAEDHSFYTNNEQKDKASNAKNDQHKGNKKKHCAKPVITTWYHQV